MLVKPGGEEAESDQGHGADRLAQASEAGERTRPWHPGRAPRTLLADGLRARGAPPWIAAMRSRAAVFQQDGAGPQSDGGRAPRRGRAAGRFAGAGGALVRGAASTRSSSSGVSSP